MSPSFPSLVHPAIASAATPTSADQLIELQTWHQQMVSYLSSTDHGLSENLASLLLELLATVHSPRFATYPYRLSAFPILDDLSADESIAEVFVWRAGIVDFLADVWDVLGTPEFSADECERAALLFFPNGRRIRGACSLCLQMISGTYTEHQSRCPVQMRTH